MNISSKIRAFTYGNSFFKSSSRRLSKISPLFLMRISIIEFITGFWFQR
jgi:hypothetical protein